MLVAGRIYQGTTLRVPVAYSDSNGVDVDPTTVTFKLMAPDRTTTTYVYGTDAQVVKESVGDYYVDVVPTQAGRWWYQWLSTGTGTATATEGNFVVQTSVFYDDAQMDAYRS
jgi:hypothetical protein